MRKTAFYDDPSFNYRQYWHGREYEHLCELIAINRLIEQIPYSRRNNLIEIGAGFGRLAKNYSQLFKKCVLLEPSQKLLNEAKKLLEKKKNLVFRQGVGESIPFRRQSFDLVLMVRVLHHLQRPEKTIKEAYRVLKPGGFLILEFANKIHFKARLMALLKRKSLDLEPIDIRSPENVAAGTIPFFNYHPLWVERMLEKYGFRIKRKLSVSNFRFPPFKRIIPFILWPEKWLQPLLGKFNFGPSIFLLAQRDGPT